MTREAVLYSRFSTSEQSRGYSLERQEKLSGEFAVARGWLIVGRIIDGGRSAFHGANRLEGSALHQFELEARNGFHRGKVLVVENIDRLSRQGPKAAAQLIWALNEGGVDVATYQDGHVYSSSNDGDMMDLFRVIILAQQAHDESAKKSSRTAATWRRRFDAMCEGRPTGPVPHTPVWIDRTDEGLVLNAHRTYVLNEIYDLYINGVGIHRIVTTLNTREEPGWTPTDGQRSVNGWFYSYIYRLLTKRSVLGEYVTGDGRTLATDLWPQAITAEKFARAQAVLALKKGNQRRATNTNRNLLAQIVVCNVCGGGAHFQHTTDTFQRYKRVNGEVSTYRRKTYRRLRCDRARRGMSCDNDTVLNYDIVEATILDELLPRLIVRTKNGSGHSELKGRVADLERLQIADQHRLTNLIDALADGGSKAIVARVSALERDIEARANDIEIAKSALANEAAHPSPADDVGEIEKLRSELTHQDDEIRTFARGRANLMLRRLIHRIAINGNGTYQVEPDKFSEWVFEENGGMLEGRYVPE